MPLEKVTFVNTYRNTPQFLQEAATAISNGGNQFKNKVKNRTTLIASRELLQPEQTLLEHIFPKQAGASSSE